MQQIRIKDATRELGRSQGYVPLHVRDEVIIDNERNAQLHIMLSAFELLPDELERVKAGAPVYVSICGSALPIGSTLVDHVRAGSGWPPIHLSVGPAPQD